MSLGRISIHQMSDLLLPIISCLIALVGKALWECGWVWTHPYTDTELRDRRGLMWSHKFNKWQRQNQRCLPKELILCPGLLIKLQGELTKQFDYPKQSSQTCLELTVKENPGDRLFPHILLVPVIWPTFSITLVPITSTPLGRSIPVSLGGTVPSGWTWQVEESQQAHTQIGNKGEAGMKLTFHLGIQPWIHYVCLGAPWHENWSQGTKDGKCCKPRQASTTAHITSTTVLPSNFWLQTAARGRKNYLCHAWACLPLPIGWLGFIKAVI